MSKRGWIAAKLVVTAGLLLYLFTVKLHPRELLAPMSRVGFGAILVGTAIALAGYWLRAWRWQVILRLFDVRVGFLRVLGIFLIGMFFSLFSPSILGTDVTRVYLVRKEHGSQLTLIVASVFLERAAGLFALLAYGLIFAFLYPVWAGPVPMAALSAAAMTVYLAVMWVVTHPHLAVRLEGPLTRQGWNLLADRLHTVAEAVAALRAERVVVLTILALSFVHQFTIMLLNWLLAGALHLNVPFRYFFVLIPMVSVLALVPATIAGFGLREAAYLALFGLVKLSPASSVSLSLLFFLVSALANLVGGVVFLFYRTRPALAAAEVEPQVGPQ